MQDLSNLTFPKTFPIEEQVKEAITYNNPLKIQTLMALGVKQNEIKKIASQVMNSSSGSSARTASLLEQAKSWTETKKKKKLPEFILSEIFKMDSSEAEENMKFYLASGGSFSSVTSFIKSSSMPSELQERVKFLDTIRRTIKLEEKFLEEHPPEKPVEKKNFFAKIFSFGEDGTTYTKEEVSKATSLFSHYIRQEDTAKLIHQACASGYNDLVVTLIGLDINIQTPYPGTGATPLHTAAWKGNTELAKWLLDHGAKIDAATTVTQDSRDSAKKGQETPLHMACSKGNKEVVKMLVGRGAKLEQPSASGHTALHYACNMDEEIALFLIESGADINAKNDKGVTPLHFACLKGFTGLVRHLLQKGADPSIIDKFNESPLQAVISQGPQKLVSELFSTNNKVKEILETIPLKKLIDYCKEHPEKLLVASKDIPSSNPLEVPFLFNDKDLASLLKFLMTPEDFNIALDDLQIKYPKLSLKVLIDANLKIIETVVPQVSAKEDIPPVPNIEFSKLESLFDNIEFYHANELNDIEQQMVYFDDKEKKKEYIFKRETVLVEGSSGVPEYEVVYGNKLEFKSLNKTSIDNMELNASGNIRVNGVETPYVIMKIGDIKMPVKIFKTEEGISIETRVELLRALLSRINFSDSNAEGYRDPDTIVDSGSSEDSAPTKVSPKQLQAGAKSLTDAINYRIPYVGTPKQDEPEKLEDWYKYLEGLVKHIIVDSIQEDFKSSQAAAEPAKQDPTPNAPFIIELAISGIHCGTRSLDDAQYSYDTKFSKPKTVKDRVFGFIGKYKTGVGEKMVDLSNPHNVHVKNKILQVIDEAFGIPESEKKKLYYFNDPIAPKVIDREKIMRIFNREFTPTSVIDVVDRAINGKPSEIDGDLILDWFKDNIPEAWEKEKYDRIKEGLTKIKSKEGKVEYLEKFDIFINPAELKKAEEPNWEKLVEGDRKYEYLGQVVQDQMTGNIKRTALIFMLKTFGVLNE